MLLNWRYIWSIPHIGTLVESPQFPLFWQISLPINPFTSDLGEMRDTSLFESTFISERNNPGINILHFFKVYYENRYFNRKFVWEKTLFANDCLLAPTFYDISLTINSKIRYVSSPMSLPAVIQWHVPIWCENKECTIIGLKILYLLCEIKGNLFDRQLCLVYIVSCFEK